jgi:hypothetical protein
MYMLFYRQGNTVIIKLTKETKTEGLKREGLEREGLSLPKKHVGSQCPCSCITELYEK